MISADERYEKKRIRVLDVELAYVEAGSGDPIVLQHGNPTSSYLWRNVIPHIESRGRCIAPDLVGMGDSDKLPNSGPDRYTFAEHRRYFDALLAALGVRERVTLVLHDWGSALGFDWARRHPDAVRGIAYMEAIAQPFTRDDFPGGAGLSAIHSEIGEQMMLEQNLFVEQMLPSQVLRGLTEEEMAVYRRPFAEPGETRRPTLTWPRQIPFEGEPADVVKVVEDYGRWLVESSVPKLFVNADPGTILVGAKREFCRSWPNQREVTVRGAHFVQEDSPDEIGRALAGWLAEFRETESLH